MTKNTQFVSHKKSSLKVGNNPKLPTASDLVDGEIAINYAEGVETLSIRNTNEDIVTFSSDNYYTEKKLGSWFTGQNSAITVTKVIEDNEKVVSSSLNDLKLNKLDVSAYTPVDLSNYYTKFETSGATEISTALGNKTDTATTSALNTVVTGHTADTTIHLTSTEKDQLHTHSNKSALDSITGSVGTMAYENTNSYSSATDVNTALSGKQNTLSAGTGIDITNDVISVTTDQVIDSGTSASTNAVATKAVYDALADKVNTSDVISAITSSNSASTNPVSVKVVAENEIVMSAALNDLETNKLDVSAYTPVDLSNYYTKSETSGATEISTALGNKTNSSDFTTHTADTTIHLTSTEKGQLHTHSNKSALDSITGSVGTMAYENVSILNGYADSVLYDSTSHKVEFYHGTTGGTKVFEFDASAFIIDGMVENVEIDDVTSGSSTVKCLVISFNTDAGKQDINVPISDIFDSDMYYTKEEIDDNELAISSALNDLKLNKLDVSAYTPTDLSNYYTKSETSGASEISTALGNKTDTATTSALNTVVTGHTADTTIHLTSTEKDQLHTHSNKSALDSITGSVGTMAYEDASSYSSATEVNTALNGKQETLTAGTGIDITDNVISVTSATITIDQVIDSGTSASTNAVATKAVYNTIKDTELVWTNAYNTLSGVVGSHTADTTIHLTSTEKGQLHTHSNKSALDSITGSVGTMAYEDASSYSSATEVNTALSGKQNTLSAGTSIDITNDVISVTGVTIDVDQVIDSGTSASTNAVATKAVYDALSAKVNTSDVISAITPSNSASTNPVSVKVVAENEIVMSSSLNDLKLNKLDVSAYTPTDLSNYYTKSETSGASEISTALNGKSNTGHSHVSSDITSMSGYSKPSTTSAISTSDTLNEAMGKLECALGGIKLQVITQAAYDALVTKDPYTLYIING